MKGRLRKEPRTGILLMKPTTTGKKPLVRSVRGRCVPNPRSTPPRLNLSPFGSSYLNKRKKP
ncbi:hypothetical protein EYF80_044476 [Liparis tanakae]|uniref:Uncharacterized protein n=1 Tax=Liparis tanakae TaxID=230148 RepID=A0A4Z2FWR9_9TELE|nr:hypothetical protein EYF80_044476 [Liparis tanakae]